MGWNHNREINETVLFQGVWFHTYRINPILREKSRHSRLGGGFKDLLFSPLLGEMIQFDYIIFFKWVETTN